MKAVYAVQCQFRQGEPVATQEQAWRLAALGAADSEGTLDEISNTPSGSIKLTNGESVEWQALTFDGDELRRLDHHTPVSESSETGWRTTVWVTRQGDAVAGVVRSGPENPDGVVTTLRFDAQLPVVVGYWVDQMHVERDGQRLATKALNLGRYDFDLLRNLIFMPDRRLPVVAISKAPDEERGSTVLLDPADLARRLAGNAHVGVVDSQLSWALTEEIGQPLSVFKGGIRIWWPGFSRADDPYRHTLVLPDRIGQDPKRAERTIWWRVWRAAVDAVAPPPLEARLRSAISRHATETRLEEMRSRLSADDRMLEEFFQQIEENARLADENDELHAQIRELQVDLARAQAQDDDYVEDDEPEVATVEEAVRLAQLEASNVVYLQSAFESARESQYPSAQQVLRDLRALHRVAHRWQQDDLPGGFDAAFDEEPVTYCKRISSTAKGKYASDYTIHYAGKEVLMGPHLRRGKGPPVSNLRIYWYVDQESRQIVVGHVGKKLRDRSNP